MEKALRNGDGGLLYREWSEKDLPALSGWFEDAETRKHLGGMLPLEAFYENTAALANQSTFLFFEGGEAVGLATIQNDGGTHSVAVLVNPQLRQRGYGKKILAAVKKMINGSVFAYVEPGNIASAELFRGCGFRCVGTDKDGFLEFFCAKGEHKTPNINLFSLPKLPLTAELTDILVCNDSVRIERIISTGQTTDWLDNAEAEFVALLDGTATIEFATGNVISMAKGDTIIINTHERHRVSFTSTAPPCVWLCVFWEE